MARKPRVRDYKAEYARTKLRAQAEGYKSVRERKAVRRRAREVQARNNRTPTYDRYQGDRDNTAIAWSANHSHVVVTEFNRDWSEAQKNAFYDTFIESPNRTRKAVDIYAYLRRWEPEYADEHRANYI